MKRAAISEPCVLRAIKRPQSLAIDWSTLPYDLFEMVVAYILPCERVRVVAVVCKLWCTLVKRSFRTHRFSSFVITTGLRDRSLWITKLMLPNDLIDEVLDLCNKTIHETGSFRRLNSATKLEAYIAEKLTKSKPGYYENFEIGVGVVLQLYTITARSCHTMMVNTGHPRGSLLFSAFLTKKIRDDADEDDDSDESLPTSDTHSSSD